MSSTAIRNLINNSIDKPIFKAKVDVQKEGRKKITKLKEQIPTTEDLKNKFTTNACSLKSQEKIFNLYKKTDNSLKKLLRRLESSKEKLTGNENQLNKINQVIETIAIILAVIAGIIIALEIIVRAAPAGLAASTGPAANETIINALGNAIDYGKAKIEEYGSLTNAITANLPKYLEKALKILAIIGAAILALNALISLIEKLMLYIQFLYAKYVENCTIANQSPINNDGTLNEDLLNGNNVIDELAIFYNDLLIGLSEGGFTLQVERVYSVIDNSTRLQRSYKLLEVPKG